jgi:DNA modification methylase
MEIIVKKITDLKGYENNARTHSKEQIQEIVDSIKDYGFNDPIEIDVSNVILSGHARIEAAKIANLDSVPTICHSHLTKNKQKGYILAANKIAQNASWDSLILKDEITSLVDDGFDMKSTGFSQEEIDDILKNNIVNETFGDPDDVSELKPDPITKLGDIWIMGNHRLMCADSREVNFVDKLLNGNNPVLMVTDPPYGVNYDPEWRNNLSLGAGERSIGKVKNDDLIEWNEVYSLFTGNIVYIWHSGKYSDIVAKNIKDCGFDIISQIIWAKNNFAISRGDYHWKHETCWYAVKKGEKHNWQGARDQSTLWEIQNTHQKQENEKIGHGTQKPIECMLRPILNNSKENDFIYDPFGGSGTTLIACEKSNRKCLMNELDPLYVDLIIRRWQKFTGKKAILESTGENFYE